jgi:hypothetical protein
MALHRLRTNNTEYIISVTPKGTLLNSVVLLPLSRMSDLSLEYYLESPNRALYSPANDTAADFSINNIEFLCDYIQSPSITNYLNTNGVKFHCSGISHRYNAILSQEHVLRLSSSHSSLNGILNVIRIASDVTDITKATKYESFYSGQHTHTNTHTQHTQHTHNTHTTHTPHTLTTHNTHTHTTHTQHTPCCPPHFRESR